MLKIKGFSRLGEEVELIVNDTDFDGAEEKIQPTKKLYDENGNIVSEEPQESIYKLHFANGRKVYVTKQTYESFIARLSLETL